MVRRPMIRRMAAPAMLVAAMAAPMAMADPLGPPAQMRAHPTALLRTYQPDLAYAAHGPADRRADDGGWSFRASVRGRSMDLGSADQGWTGDPGAGPRDVEAGYDWRGGAASMVIGYQQYVFPPHDPLAVRRFVGARPPDSAAGVFGFSVILRTH